MKRLGNIFSFTFIQHVKQKGYRNVTVVVAVLCLLLPAVILPAIEYFKEDETYVSKIDKVYVVETDSSTEGKADYGVLNSVDAAQFTDVVYEMAENVEDAAKKAEEDGHSVVLAVGHQEGTYQLNVLLPDETKLNKKDANAYETFLSGAFRYILIQKSNLEAAQIAEMTMPIETVVRDSSVSADESDEYAVAKEVMATILPYLNIMILYFMILAYGQGTANSAIMEKTSKLMDLLLVSVKPGEMLLGKVFAMAASGVLQIFIWLAGLFGGFALGIHFTKMVNPNTDMILIQLVESFGEFSGMFTVSGVILALLMLSAGLLLYCSLAAIGGAIAEKPEDLSSTNMLFVMVLLVSFFATMFAGGAGSDVPWDAVTWQVWMPFTSILVAPTKILLGVMSIPEAALSLGIVVVTATLITIASGKVYKMMSLYKGNPPSPKKMIEMMRRQR
ncbi:MAG: ABC transporter permease [Dorea sp.]|jgi:ABC-type Na+ efflux pump permease subunit|nr:ABC transporter permease [Dorea sp.]